MVRVTLGWIVFLRATHAYQAPWAFAIYIYPVHVMMILCIDYDCLLYVKVNPEITLQSKI